LIRSRRGKQIFPELFEKGRGRRIFKTSPQPDQTGEKGRGAPYSALAWFEACLESSKGTGKKKRGGDEICISSL